MPDLRTQLRLTQTQKLAMTQTLRQQLEILQMPSMELEGLIAAELAENPLLEESGNSSDQTEGEPPADEQSSDETDDEPERDDAKEDDPLDILREIDEEMGTMSSSRYVEEEQWQPEHASPVTLSEHLLSQLDTLELPDPVENASVYVIYSLDRNGLLTLPPEELLTGWDGPQDVLDRAIETVRDLDPPGVAQSSSRDALLHQLRLGSPGDERRGVALRIIEECFEDLAERRVLPIASRLGVTPRQVEEAIELIRTLNPWPGSEFAGGFGTPVVPDVIIERHGDRMVVYLNDDRFPHLSINERNRRILESPSSDSIEREYVKKKFKRAGWFIKSIRQRQDTVTRIARFISERQRDFLVNGVDALKPLTLQEAAEALGFNQSTISRAINGKYVQSPQGIHEMRYYFSRGSADSSIAAETVREEIRRLVSGEDSANPLSDERIAEILTGSGMAVKRRTVANYRNQMDIPGARKRRRF
jgi:RNA polymerase sigma-54 factor